MKIGGLLRTASLTATLAAAGLMFGGVNAQAADLGGDCCADLEERVAELEATTVRKGNRKVSLTVSGYVSHHIMFWDDGVRSDMYIGDGGNYGTRWRFVGTAKISPTLTAGFLYEFGISENSISSADQEHRNTATARNNGDDQGGGFALRDTTVWLRHTQLGMIKIGHGSTATDNLVLIDLGGLAGAATPDVSLFGGGMRLPLVGAVENYSAQTWTNLIRGHESWDATRRNHVLYETPSLAGFTVQAAIAEDNFWDVALRYAGEFGGFRIAAGIGYSRDSEFDTRTAAAAFTGGVVTCNADCAKNVENIMGSASVIHVQSGLFVTGAAGRREQEFATTGQPNATGDFWWLAGGISKNFFGPGRTVLFGEYGRHNDFATFVTNTNITSSEATTWGIGLVQYIDAAAMEVFITYKHFEGEWIEGGLLRTARDMDLVIIGTRINF